MENFGRWHFIPHHDLHLCTSVSMSYHLLMRKNPALTSRGSCVQNAKTRSFFLNLTLPGSKSTSPRLPPHPASAQVWIMPMRENICHVIEAAQMDTLQKRGIKPDIPRTTLAVSRSFHHDPQYRQLRLTKRSVGWWAGNNQAVVSLVMSCDRPGA